ncbi:iron complex outermembrane receptor protein [Povalibacter uvarum]|uniref:Iron complex outermembrane receptor protein n=1 Tax=Povalibacter uvarum TaxID=732238 RepID=A0A841HL57_9GAMM|nr:TonB-dependent receptor [Povalibacter uvarum]MBB6093797.1 iron complex outermembrane receptor protein [Povalibacter uvarum]
MNTRTTTLSRRRIAAIASAVAAALSQGAQAQSDESKMVLEEVVVSAERREVNLQDVPISATVLTGESLAAQGIDNIVEIQQVAPSVAINTYNRSTFINIRGVGIAQSAPTSNPGVAYYIDGVFIPHEQFIAQSFFDIESLEVLRGPQGTLTGQNSTGGAVYVRTPAPTFDEFSGYVDQTIADYDWYRTVGAINVPVSDTLAIRLSGVYDTRGSFTENIGPSPSEPGSGDDTAVRAAVRWQPTDGATFDLRYEYFKRETDYNAVKNRNDLVTGDPFTIEEDARSFLNQDGYRASIEARIDLSSSIQLRALTSYFDAENEDQADGDRTATALPVPPNRPTNGANTALFPGRVGLTRQGLETWVSELNLLSTGDGRLQWVVGAFYMDEESPVEVLRDNRNTTDFVQSNSTIDAKAFNTSASVFGQIDFRLTDSWMLDVGVRYSDDKQEYTRYLLPGAPPPGCFPCTNVAESTETTGRVGVKFFATDDTLLYATASKGYKAGGVNLDPRLSSYGPETNQVAELGLKTTIADGRLRINTAVFYSDYEGIQLSALTPVGTPPALLPNTQNAAPAEIYGAELELTAQFDRLGLNVGLSALHSEFTEDQTLTDSQTNTNRLVPEGSTVPFAPEVTATAGIQYEFSLGSTTLTPRIQVSYMDEQLATPFPYAATTVPSRTVTDVRVTWLPMENLRLEAFATNVFDEEYIAVQLQDASSAQGGMIYGAPLQYGLRAKFDF